MMKVIILNGPMGVGKTCPWRTDEWLKISTESLANFSSLSNTLDTSNLSIEEAANQICAGL